MLIPKGALVVSCQAHADNPLHGPVYMSAMAKAAEAGGAGLLDRFRDLENLVAALDRTRPGDDADLARADSELAGDDAGRLLLDLGAGHLVRREDRHDLLDAFAGFEGLFVAVALLTKGGDDGPLGADDDVALEAELLDQPDDVVDLFLGGFGLHDDDHLNLTVVVGHWSLVIGRWS